MLNKKCGLKKSDENFHQLTKQLMQSSVMDWIELETKILRKRAH